MKIVKKAICLLLAMSMSVVSSVSFSGCSEIGLLFSALSTVKTVSLQNSTALEVMKRAAKDVRAAASLMGEDTEEAVNSVKLQAAQVKTLKYSIANETGKGVICCKLSYSLGGLTETMYCSANFSSWDTLSNFSSNAMTAWNNFIVDEDYEKEYVDISLVNSGYATYILNGKF